MNGNIVGEPIDGFVQLQINARQSNQFSGYGNTLRTPEQLQYLNNRNAWVKLASSVKITNPNRLSDIGIINPSRFSSTGLAENAILFNTLSSYANSKLNSERAGIGKETTATFFDSIYFTGASDVWNDTYAYGIGGSDFGLQPPPGITGVQVDSLNRGSIRKANVTLKAHNKFQFDVIELLYLRLGFTMMLEWGWDRYLDNGGNLQPVSNTIIEERWFNSTSNGITQRAMLNHIQSLREKYVGNYDGFFGKVSNFTWSFNPDGSYDISIDLITLGDIIESLKVNTLAKTITTEGKSGTINFKEGTNLFGTNISKVTNINTIGYFLYTKIYELTNQFKTNQNIASTDTNYYSITPKVITINNQTGTSATTPIASNPGNEGWSPQYYIRLGEFFSQLERLVVPVVKNGGGSAVSQITFNGIGNLISYFPNQIPLDPRVCVFKPSINSRGDMEGIPIPAELNNIPAKYVTTVGGRAYGQLSNLYINFEFIAGLLVSNGGPDQELPLIKFLQDLCNGINNALGGFNKLEPIIKDDYIVTIIDQTLSTSGKENFINLEVYGYNPSTNNPTSNFVKDVKFVSKITPQLASMISIGATAAGNNTAEIDGTAFSKFSEGLEDRFTQRISEPNGLNDLQKQRTEQEQQQKNQEDWEIIKYAQENFKTFPTSADGFTAKNIEVQQSFSEFITGENLFFAELLGLEDVPLPFTGGKSISDLAREATAANDEMKDIKLVNDPGYNIENKRLTYQEYLYEIFLFQQNLKDTNTIREEDVSKITPENYALYLSLAFGAETEVTVFVKSFTTETIVPGRAGMTAPSRKTIITPSKFVPLKQFRYLEFNEAFIAEGKAAYKNYITNLNNETYIETLTPSSGIGFIPLSFELTLDGISGVKIYNQLSINNEFLPSNYPKSLKFVITKVNHKITNNNWETSLSTISIPRTEPYKFVEAPVILSNTGGGSGGVADPNVVTKSLTTGIDLTTTQLDKSAFPNGVIYVPEETKKTMIFLHHTAGRGGATPTIGWWRVAYKRDKTGAKIPIDYPLCTHYIIDREGNVEYVFDEKYWAYHASSSTKVQKSSISVELSAYGWLVDDGNGNLKNSLGDIVPLNEAALAVDKDGKPTPYRGYKYFDKYTDKQIEALKGLFTNWKNKKDFKGNPTNHSIDFKFNFDEMFPGEDPNLITKENPRGRILSQNAVNGIPGVYAHNSTAEYKVDVFPQAELVSMLKSVLAPN
jgi:hypothetical protein